MNTIYGKILWRTSLPVLLLLFLAVSCKQSEQHSSWEKKYDSFYRSVTDSLTTHPQQIRALAKQKMEMSTACRRYGFGYCLLYRFLQTTFAGNEDRISPGYSYQSG